MRTLTFQSRETNLQSYGEVDHDPSVIYGAEKGPVAFRLGNGGAGPTGILRRLSEDFLDEHASGQSVPWVCNHSRNTQLALFYGDIDIALTYERDQEDISVRERWAVPAGVILHDHFVVVGPRANPAQLALDDSPAECFRKIKVAADAGLALFHSRADGSATMIKERQLWARNELSPWQQRKDADWYKMSHDSPAVALIAADKAGAYLLSDRSTLLRQTADRTISRSTVFYEPLGPQDLLMNSCAALISTSPPALAKSFIRYTLSPRAQDIISTYGISEVGVPFFAALRDGFAAPILRGGAPANGRWRVVPNAKL